MEWEVIKDSVVTGLALSRDQLHMAGGGILFFLILAILRCSPRNALPWLATLGVELINEAMDMVTQVGHGQAADWPESLRDIVTTMTIPTACIAFFLTLQAMTPIQRSDSPSRTANRRAKMLARSTS